MNALSETVTTTCLGTVAEPELQGGPRGLTELLQLALDTSPSLNFLRQQQFF